MIPPLALALSLALSPAPPASRTPADDTLRGWLDRSGYALTAEILSEPHAVPFSVYGAGAKADGWVLYACRVKATEQFHWRGTSPMPAEFTAYVLRRQAAGEGCPAALKKGSACILFLNWQYALTSWQTEGTCYVTSDPWFGVQAYSPKMAELLRLLGWRPQPAN